MSSSFGDDGDEKHTVVKQSNRNWRTLFMFKEDNIVRLRCTKLIEHKHFDRFVVVVILVNSLMLALNDPVCDANTLEPLPGYEGHKCNAQLANFLNVAEYVFGALFTLEFLVKVISMGLFMHKGTYLRDAWNWIDFMVVFLGWISILPQVSNVSALRVVRVVRPLRTMSRIKGMRVLVNSMVGALVPLGNVLLLCGFIFAVFGVVGMQFMSGALRGRCYSTEGDTIGQEIFPFVDYGPDFICSTGGHGAKCPDGSECLAADPVTGDLHPNPSGQRGFLHFDNIGSSSLVIFQVITREGWTDLMYNAEAGWNVWGARVFFVILILVGSFFVVNLALAVISESFSKSSSDTADAAKERAFTSSVSAVEAALRLQRPTPVIGTRNNQMFSRVGGPPVALPKSASSRWRLLRNVAKIAPKRTTLMMYKIRLQRTCESVVTNAFFGHVMMALIFLNTACLAAEYHSQPLFEQHWDEICPPEGCTTEEGLKVLGMQPELATVLDLLNVIVTLCFVVEMALKLVGLGWRRYSGNAADLFDGTVVILSVMELILDSTGVSSAAGLSALRAFRLFRIFKLARKWTLLRAVLLTIKLSMTSLGPLSFVLVLLTYIFSLLGMQFFGGHFLFTDSNGDVYRPKVNFDSLLPSQYGFGAAISIFCVLSGENWNTVLYNAMFGTSEWAVVYFVMLVLLGMYLILNLFMAILIQGFEYAHKTEKKSQSIKVHTNAGTGSIIGGLMRKASTVFARTPTARTPTARTSAWPATVRTRGMSVTGDLNVVPERGPDMLQPSAALAPLSSTSLTQLQEHVEESFIPSHRPPLLLPPSPARPPPHMGTLTGGTLLIGGSSPSALLNPTAGSAGHTPDRVLMSTISGPLQTLPSERASTIIPPPSPSTRATYLDPSSAWSPASLRTISEPSPLSSRRPSHMSLNPSENGDGSNEPPPPPGRMRKAWDFLVARDWAMCMFPKTFAPRIICGRLVAYKHFDTVILVCICVSSVLIVIQNPLRVLPEQTQLALDILDFIFLAVFTLEMLLKIVVHGFLMGHEAYIRDPWNMMDASIVMLSYVDLAATAAGGSVENLSALRTLRTLRALRPLRLIKRNQGMKICVQCLLRSIPSVSNVMFVCFALFGIFGVLGVQLFKGTFWNCYDTEGALAKINVATNEPIVTWKDCVAAGGEWKNSRTHFDSLPSALLTLFEMSTLEGWIIVMGNGVDAVGPGFAPENMSNPAVSVFFVIFIIVGGFFLINLFIGVVIDNYNRVKDDNNGAAFMSQEQRVWVQAQQMIIRVKPIRLVLRPDHWLRGKCFDIAYSHQFEIASLVAVLLNILLMMTYHNDQTTAWNTAYNIGSSFFAWLFFLEVIFKWYALGVVTYFRSNWNRFDFVVTAASIAGFFASVVFGIDGGAAASLPRVFRLGRAFRIAKSLKGLGRLFETLVYSFPALVNIGSLLALLFCIFAALGVNFFANVAHGDFVHTRANFEDFGTAFITLFRSVTGEDWNGIMHDCMQGTCRDPEFEGIGCGGPVVALVFFFAFNVICNFIMLNLFIAPILDSFTLAVENEADTLTPAHLEAFVSVWAKVDPGMKGFCSASDVHTVVLNLDVPLGVKDDPLIHRGKPRTAAAKLIGALNLPVYHDKVHYLDLLHALAERVAGVKIPESVTMVAELGAKRHQTMLAMSRKKGIDIDCDHKDDFAQMQGALLVQKFFRERSKRRLAVKKLASVDDDVTVSTTDNNGANSDDNKTRLPAPGKQTSNRSRGVDVDINGRGTSNQTIVMLPSPTKADSQNGTLATPVTIHRSAVVDITQSSSSQIEDEASVVDVVDL